MASNRDVSTAARDATKRWLEAWAGVGPLLEAERWDRLQRASDAEMDRDVLLVLALWQPQWRGDDGEELLRHQAAFARAHRRNHG